MYELIITRNCITQQLAIDPAVIHFLNKPTHALETGPIQNRSTLVHTCIPKRTHPSLSQTNKKGINLQPTVKQACGLCMALAVQEYVSGRWFAKLHFTVSVLSHNLEPRRAVWVWDYQPHISNPGGRSGSETTNWGRERPGMFCNYVDKFHFEKL